MHHIPVAEIVADSCENIMNTTWNCPTFPQQTPKEWESLILRYLKLWYQRSVLLCRERKILGNIVISIYIILANDQHPHQCWTCSRNWMPNCAIRAPMWLCHDTKWICALWCSGVSGSYWLHASYSQRSMMTLLDTHFLWPLLGMPYGHCYCSSNTSSGYTRWPSKTGLWV